jgi:hypothetical protein
VVGFFNNEISAQKALRRDDVRKDIEGVGLFIALPQLG